MKAVILAAGMGTRLDKYTRNKPKGLLEFNGKSLIEHQLDIFRASGVSQVAVVTGYMFEKIDFKGLRYYNNSRYDTTNMVESFMTARNEFDDDIIVSYADIVFERTVLDTLIDQNQDFCVTVDTDWQDYWTARYDRPDYDLEGLKMDGSGRITEIGLPDPPLDEIDGRYVGLLKFSRKGIEKFTEVYDKSKTAYATKSFQASRTFEQAYMTDMLSELIHRGHGIHASIIQRGWLEFDTNQDYERSISWVKNGQIHRYFSI